MKKNKHSKKEMQDLVELTSKLLKKMDGYSIYICLKSMSGIMANMIVTHVKDQENDEKMKEVFDMIETAVRGREMIDKILNMTDEKVH